jgi:hypothetical protein
MEEYSRRGSNQRMRPKRAGKPTISNRWFSGNFRLALTLGGDHDLARHGFISDYRSGRSAVLAVDDGKFAALDRGDDNRRLKDGVDGESRCCSESFLSSIGRKHEFFETAKGSVIIARSGSILEPKDRGRLQ